MGIETFLTGIGVIASIIGVGLFAKYTGLGDLLSHFTDWIKAIYSWFNDYMPKSIKPFFFLLFIMIFASTLFGFMLNFHFFCTTNDIVRVADVPIIGGIGLFINQFFVGWDEQEGTADYNNTYDAYIHNETDVYKTSEEGSAEDMVRIECKGGKPYLTLYGLEIFDYRTWIMLFVIGFIIKLILYFKK